MTTIIEKNNTQHLSRLSFAVSLLVGADFREEFLRMVSNYETSPHVMSLLKGLELGKSVQCLAEHGLSFIDEEIVQEDLAFYFQVLGELKDLKPCLRSACYDAAVSARGTKFDLLSGYRLQSILEKHRICLKNKPVHRG